MRSKDQLEQKALANCHYRHLFSASRSSCSLHYHLHVAIRAGRSGRSLLRPIAAPGSSGNFRIDLSPQTNLLRPFLSASPPRPRSRVWLTPTVVPWLSSYVQGDPAARKTTRSAGAWRSSRSARRVTRTVNVHLGESGRSRLLAAMAI